MRKLVLNERRIVLNRLEILHIPSVIKKKLVAQSTKKKKNANNNNN